MPLGRRNLNWTGAGSHQIIIRKDPVLLRSPEPVAYSILPTEPALVTTQYQNYRQWPPAVHAAHVTSPVSRRRAQMPDANLVTD